MAEAAPKTLLVVEDNAIIREGLATVLREHGYFVVTAENGQQALDVLLSVVQPDLILLDMLMPVLDGWRFLERLEKIPLDPSTRIIIATGTIISREWAEEHGCAGFLKKPIGVGDLLTEVRRCLGEV